MGQSTIYLKCPARTVRALCDVCGEDFISFSFACHRFNTRFHIFTPPHIHLLSIAKRICAVIRIERDWERERESRTTIQRLFFTHRRHTSDNSVSKLTFCVHRVLRRKRVVWKNIVLDTALDETRFYASTLYSHPRSLESQKKKKKTYSHNIAEVKYTYAIIKYCIDMRITYILFFLCIGVHAAYRFLDGLRTRISIENKKKK